MSEQEIRGMTIRVIVSAIIGLGIAYVVFAFLSGFLAGMLDFSDHMVIFVPLYGFTVFMAIYSVIINILILKGIIHREKGFPFSVCGNIWRYFKGKIRDEFNS